MHRPLLLHRRSLLRGGTALALKHATSRTGRPLHFLFNYSAKPVTVTYDQGDARDLLTGRPLARGATASLLAWGVVVAEESRTTPRR